MSEYNHKVTALAVLAKINKIKNVKHQDECDDCTKIAHSDGWQLYHCPSITLFDDSEWYITHKKYGAYFFLGEFTWPI